MSTDTSYTLTLTLSTSLARTASDTIKVELEITKAEPATVPETTLNLAKLFAIEVLPASADATNPIYRFSHVVSVSELVEFPEDTPGENSYFRISKITMLFNSVEAANKTIALVKSDLTRFKNEYTGVYSSTPTVTVVTI